MGKLFPFTVESNKPPVLEITDQGIYVRFIEDAKIVTTIVRSEWPRLTVDLDARKRTVGIEVIPMPEEFSLGLIARQAGVALPANLSASEMPIRQAKIGSMLACCAGGVLRF